MSTYQDLKQNSVFIEMGTFHNYGGWVLDTQFIPNMGSAHLLAHGLGTPVSDATTTICIPTPGKYKLWAFTRDWVAPWKTGVAPGLFKIKIGGKLVGTVFGNQTSEWQWQSGGIVDISTQNTDLALCDLTGFEGRCGAIFLTQDMDFEPPNDIGELETMRRILCGNDDITFDGKYDLVIAGAGFAGMCAAVSAARRGVKVALIQDRDVIAGNNSSEVRVWLGGEINFEPFPKVGDIVKEFHCEKKAHYGPDNTGEIYEDDKKLAVLQKEPNINLYMGYFAKDVIMQGNTIKSVIIYNVKDGSHKRLDADLFADCSGDSIIGAAAGADFEVTTNGHMGMTNVWNIKDTGEPQPFPKCPWAIDLSGVQFPGRGNVGSTYNQTRTEAFGGWYWESGNEHDPIEKAEYARDTNLRAMYGAWDCVKNTDNDYDTYKLNFSAYIGGKRESRRMLGDIILNKSDVYKGVKFPDAIVPTTWNFDVHYPDRAFYPAFHEGDGFLTKDYHEPFNTPYFIPYRVMYSRNISNLFMAGRNVSVTHDALGTVRVMRTGGMMGEVVGAAAKVCIEHNVLPRDVYESHLDELLGSLR